MIDVRRASYEILYKVLEEKQFSHIKLSEMFRDHPDLSKRDRAFIEHLVRSTIEHLYEIDAHLNHVSKTPVKKMRPQIRTILRFSAASLLFMDSVPESAACNEAVKLANKLGFFKLKGFVNGVMRNLARELAAGFVLSDKSLSMRFSMPAWLVESFISQFGEEKTETILTQMQKPVKLSVFRNPLKGSLGDLEAALKKDGIEARPLPYDLDGFYLENIGGLEKCLSFKEGRFLIQDVSSMIEGLLVNARPGMKILDVCAAPGGKSIHAALSMEGKGEVTSCDLTSYKTGLIKQNVARFQLENLRVLERDAQVFDKELENYADVLIADLPCSGLGIMGRKPEIRFNMTKEDIKSLAELQRSILANIVRYVKPGGRIVYSTCTLTMEEDEDNYRYLTEELHMQKEDLGNYLPFEAASMKDGYLKLVPGLYESDGFFIASAVKPAE